MGSLRARGKPARPPVVNSALIPPGVPCLQDSVLSTRRSCGGQFVGASQRTILVVENAADASDALAALCVRMGHEAACAQDGPRGLQRVLDGGVDLVLVDLGLPADEGLELIRHLRASPDRRHLPIIALGSRDKRDLRLEALRQGADDVVAAPWDEEELALRMGRALSLRAQVDALVQEAQALHELSVTDGLTQTHNHRFFQDRLKEEFRRAQRYDDPLALVLLDVDHFKAVNDLHGHPVGDEVLCAVAHAIRQAVRDTDLVARYGGEEFAVILPRTGLPGALTVAERIWRAVGALQAGPGRAVRVTASLGVAGYPGRNVLAPDQLLRSADEALYRAKREGRNKICLFQQVTFFSPPAARAV